MSTINFGGLATGLDTEGIISALMELEREPLNRLENDKKYYTSRLNAFKSLETKLNDMLSAMEALETADDVKAFTAKATSEEYFSVVGSSSADSGSYQLEVISLAQVEKQVSQGYLDKSSATFGTGTINLTVDGELTEIAIDGTNNSLSGIAQAINAADTGVSATVINDGTGTPYRLVLTGDQISDAADGVASFISLDASALSGGTDAAPSFTMVRTSEKAHVQIDGIDIYHTGNSLTEAIPGLTIDLAKENEPGESTIINVSADPEAAKEKINAFVKAYNSIITFMDDQKETSWGTDPSLRTVERRLQSLLVASVDGAGSYDTLSRLGISSDQKTGLISLSESKLDEALSANMDDVVALFAGSDGADGIAAQFIDFLEKATDSSDGILAAKEDSTEKNIRRIDGSITRMEYRLEQREATLRAQYEALELLMSQLNSQGDYLTQALSAMNPSNK